MEVADGATYVNRVQVVMNRDQEPDLVYTPIDESSRHLDPSPTDYCLLLLSLEHVAKLLL